MSSVSFRRKYKVLSDMKSSRLLVWSLLAVMAVAASPALGQDTSKYEVPFAFSIGDRVLPAGSYSVQHLFSGSPMLLLTGPAGGTQVMAPMSEYSREAASKLVFHRYGSRYFLTQVWFGGNGAELFHSAAEKEYESKNDSQEQLILAER